jgi:tRNA threonylcarbamoyladenosine biosynthesis protein TsaB
MLHGQAEKLLPLAGEVMRKACLPVSAIDLVAVTTGPGSFTGIRVGLAAARGIALAGNFRLLGITSFEAAAAAFGAAGFVDGCLLVAIESRRADLFIQLFDPFGLPLSAPAAVPPPALAEAVANAVASGRQLAIAGDAANRAANALASRPGTIVVQEVEPTAIGVARAALRRWRKGERSETVTPLYLRPPDVTFPGGRTQ